MTETMTAEVQGIEIRPVITKKAYSAVSSILNVIALVLVAVICYSHLCVALIPSESMEPTLHVGDRIMYQFATGEDLTYDDIVLFFPYAELDHPISNGIEALYRSKVKKDTIFIKRVIGLPGDVLEMKDGYVYRNVEKLNPDYIAEPIKTNGNTYVVPEGQIFCMGDNRNDSYDSRYLGAIPMNNFIGKLCAHF